MGKGEDAYFMKLALRLARRGAGWVSPNPMVGAVLVKDGRVISTGYHRRYGGDHAEVDAIKRSKGPLKGATLYVNLEPCCHWGKTPPCTEAILRAGIEEVVVANLDPNPLVAGKGIEILRSHGIKVRVGVLEEEGRLLNRAYFKHYEEGLPLVTAKWAQSLDGRIATTTGDSKWISSEGSRRYAHRLRSLHDAVLVGIGTVLRDDPELTVRLVKGKNPLRVILDSRLSIPLEAKALKGEAKTLLATTEKASPEKEAILRQKGIEVIRIGCERVDLFGLLKALAERKVLSVLVEGGREVLTEFFKKGFIDRVMVFVSPKIIGQGVEAIGDLGIREVGRAIELKSVRTLRIGQDLLLEGWIKP